jgi:tetratricopeptide (TPR) repeat protein
MKALCLALLALLPTAAHAFQARTGAGAQASASAPFAAIPDAAVAAHRRGLHDQAYRAVGAALDACETRRAELSRCLGLHAFAASTALQAGLMARAQMHARQLLRLARGAGASERVYFEGNAYLLLGRVALESGDSPAAETQARAAHALFLASYGRNSVLGAHALSAIGHALYRQGRYAEAEQLHRAALPIILANGGECCHSVSDLDYLAADSFTGLGVSQKSQARWTDAEQNLRQALRRTKAYYGERHPQVAVAYGNLGSTLTVAGRPERAEAYHRRALAIVLRTSEPQAPFVAGFYANLGLSLVRQGEARSAEAEAYYRRALAAALRRRGNGHLDLAIIFSGLSAVMRAQGRGREEEEFLRRAIAVRAPLQQGTTPELIWLRLDLGRVWRDRHPVEGYALIDQAITGLETRIGALETAWLHASADREAALYGPDFLRQIEAAWAAAHATHRTPAR